MTELAEKQDLRGLVDAEYAGKDIVVHPTYPHVLVRVLPKGTVYKGMIVLPDSGQTNKPVYEGQVLDTFAPKEVDGTLVSPSVSVGMHVIFEHWVGIPIPGLCGIEWKKGEYRLIREEQIIAWLSTSMETRTFLIDFIKRYRIESFMAEKIADGLLDRAAIVPFLETPLTRSGV